MHLVKLEEIPGAKEELKEIRKRFYDWMKDPSAFSEYFTKYPRNLAKQGISWVYRGKCSSKGLR